MSKYKKWYDSIIENASNRINDGYVEVHHILPRSLGGTNDKSNLVKLTAREHFICHWLLVKVYDIGEEHWKMLNALRIMRADNVGNRRYNTKITARVYENLKEEYAKLQSERVSGVNNPMYGAVWTQEMIDAVRLANTGRIQPPEEKAKQIAAMTGKTRDPFSDEWKQNISTAMQGENNPMYGKHHSEETKQKIKEKATGRKMSPETLAKRSASQRGSKRELVDCPHCGKRVPVNGYARWHGDNCKHKK